jgi:integrase/recombinase XerD
MRVQRVVMPDSGVESWTVLGEDGIPLEPVERFLAYLASIERSPNTIKAYAHDLKGWFSFLTLRRLDWQAVTVEDVAGFVGWLRLPPAARDGQVRVLPTVEVHCGGTSVNRKLAALTSSVSSTPGWGCRWSLAPCRDSAPQTPRSCAASKPPPTGSADSSRRTANYATPPPKPSANSAQPPSAATIVVATRPERSGRN